MHYLFGVSIILNEGISPLMMRQKMQEDMMEKAWKERLVKDVRGEKARYHLIDGTDPIYINMTTSCSIYVNIYMRDFRPSRR